MTANSFGRCFAGQIIFFLGRYLFFVCGVVGLILFVCPTLLASTLHLHNAHTVRSACMVSLSCMNNGGILLSGSKTLLLSLSSPKPFFITNNEMINIKDVLTNVSTRM